MKFNHLPETMMFIRLRSSQVSCAKFCGRNVQGLE